MGAVRRRRPTELARARKYLLDAGEPAGEPSTPGIPQAKRTSALLPRGFDIAEESLNYCMSNLRGRMQTLILARVLKGEPGLAWLRCAGWAGLASQPATGGVLSTELAWPWPGWLGGLASQLQLKISIGFL